MLLVLVIRFAHTVYCAVHCLVHACARLESLGSHACDHHVWWSCMHYYVLTQCERVTCLLRYFNLSNLTHVCLRVCSSRSVRLRVGGRRLVGRGRVPSQVVSCLFLVFTFAN